MSIYNIYVSIRNVTRNLCQSPTEGAPVSNLTTLSMARCKIRSFHKWPKFQTYLPMLETLILNDNEIGSLASEWLPTSLITLELNRNRIYMMAHVQLNDSVVLKTLSVNENQMESIESPRDLPVSITSLSAMGNKLQYLDLQRFYEHFERKNTTVVDKVNASEVMTLNIQENVLSCSCEQAKG